jgi:hypothetical protein
VSVFDRKKGKRNKMIFFVTFLKPDGGEQEKKALPALFRIREEGGKPG